MHPTPVPATRTPTTSSPAAPSASSASSAVPPSPSSSPRSPRSPRPSASSAPSVSPTSADDPDPDPRTTTRREEAFTLYCQGYRSPAIATLLGVPQRTVRAWIAATLQATADESRTRRDQQLRLAIESQRAIVQAAWHAYDRAARAERLTLEHLQNAVPVNVDDDDDANLYDAPAHHGVGGAQHAAPGQRMRTSPAHALPRLPTLGARYLQIVLHAQREIARLSGLYHLPDAFYDPNAGRPMQIVIRREAHLPREQRAAWTAFRQQWDADHPGDPVPPDDLVFPPPGAPLHDYAEPDDPDDPESDDPDFDPDGGPDAPEDPPHPDDPEDADSVPPGAAHAKDPAAELQPAQADFEAERPLGADASASPPALRAGASAPRPPDSESAAETASLNPSSSSAPAPAADPAAANAVESPPAAVHPGGPIPQALLPRFRRRSGPAPRPTFHPLIRGAP